MKQKVMKVGNSLGVTVPAYFVKVVGLKAGDWVEVKTQSEEGKISYFFVCTHQLPLLQDFDTKKK
jgi:antitoxin component of MazEF toxin-antitoxin module